MRILVVSDIHANWAALSAIDEPYDVCLCLGDLVDYGPDPLPCVRWAMDHATYAIRGNHDHGVAQGIPVTGESGFRYLTKATRPSMWEALGPEERRYLLQLPVTRRFTLDGKRFLLVHATPRDPLDEYLLKDPGMWAKRVHNVEADIVCVGHTHVQFNLPGGQCAGAQSRQRGSSARRRSPAPPSRSSKATRSSSSESTTPSSETVARIEEMPWPRRAKEITASVLRLGRLSTVMERLIPDIEDEPSTG